MVWLLLLVTTVAMYVCLSFGLMVEGLMLAVMSLTFPFLIDDDDDYGGCA